MSENESEMFCLHDIFRMQALVGRDREKWIKCPKTMLAQLIMNHSVNLISYYGEMAKTMGIKLCRYICRRNGIRFDHANTCILRIFREKKLFFLLNTIKFSYYRINRDKSTIA